MGDIPRTAHIQRHNLLDPRLIGDHLFGDTVNRHRLRTDGAVGANQMAHGIGNLSVDNINRGDFNNASLQSAGFCIDYAQHGSLQAKETSVMQHAGLANSDVHRGRELFLFRFIGQARERNGGQSMGNQTFAKPAAQMFGLFSFD